MTRQLQDTGGSHQSALTGLQRERDAASASAEAAHTQLQQREAALQVSSTLLNTLLEPVSRTIPFMQQDTNESQPPCGIYVISLFRYSCCISGLSIASEWLLCS